MDKVLLDSERSSHRRMRISISEFKNKQRIDLRIYYKGDDGNFHPSKQGVSIEDPAVLEEVIQALEKARNELSN